MLYSNVQPKKLCAHNLCICKLDIKLYACAGKELLPVKTVSG